MKSALSILLLFSFLLVNVSKSIILVNYEVNKKEITDKYCVNKDKPQMHCCGKCLLKKKLAEQEEQQKLPVFPDIKTDITPVHQVCQVHQVYKVSYIPHYELDKLFTQNEAKGIFHPPCC